MGVKECDRAGCENIMCDVCVGDYYVCWECCSEFRELVGEEKIPSREMSTKFVEFMSSPKSLNYKEGGITVDEFLEIDQEEEDY